MKDLIQKTVALLKLRVKSNLEVINKNQVRIKEILKQPASAERSFTFEKHYEVNKNLLSENNDFINVQLTLINFLEKYKNSDALQESLPAIDVSAISDEEELMNITLNGTLPFDEDHPFFGNEKFFSRLMRHYQVNEQYEKCQELMDLRKKFH